VQALPSSQLAGQGSQVSPSSTTPLPQIGEQSGSLLALHPAGQQPSPDMQVAIVLLLQTTLQLAALPVKASVVQAFPSLQLAGQDAGGSQVSPVSTMLLPQTGEQSESLFELHPAGQQPSPDAQLVIAVWRHATLQLAAFPVIWSSVQALVSLQLLGHVEAGSQTSPGSIMPLPQTGRQSESLLASHPAGQQPSPETHSTVGS
jgi:hypothetical protein